VTEDYYADLAAMDTVINGELGIGDNYGYDMWRNSLVMPEYAILEGMDSFDWIVTYWSMSLV